MPVSLFFMRLQATKPTPPGKLDGRSNGFVFHLAGRPPVLDFRGFPGGFQSFVSIKRVSKIFVFSTLKHLFNEKKLQKPLL